MEKTKQVLAICLVGLISVMADDAQANSSALTEQLPIAPAPESSIALSAINESEIPRLQDFEQRATMLREWLAQSNAQATVRITDIQINTSIDRLARCKPQLI